MGQDVYTAEKADSYSLKSFKHSRCRDGKPVCQGLLLGRLTIFLLLKVSDLLWPITSLNCAERQTLLTNTPRPPAPQRHEIPRRPLRHSLAAGTWK